ncbi:MAG: hypothetical protein VX944_12000, partial [Myxococcota bacterium]|nr:hypothetical protein [Myxococcota bacterium]
ISMSSADYTFEADFAIFSLASAGDVDGDGQDDLILGSPTAEFVLPGGYYIGKAYLILTGS